MTSSVLPTPPIPKTAHCRQPWSPSVVCRLGGKRQCLSSSSSSRARPWKVGFRGSLSGIRQGNWAPNLSPPASSSPLLSLRTLVAIEGSGRLRDNPTPTTFPSSRHSRGARGQQETGNWLTCQQSTYLGPDEKSRVQQSGEHLPSCGLGPGPRQRVVRVKRKAEITYRVLLTS